MNSAIRQKRYTISELNNLEREIFVRVTGPVFEHSPWIAEAAWRKRPFADLETLHHAVCDIVKNAGETKHLALIRAHPDLAARASLAARLTRESVGEQAAAGLNDLSPDEAAFFQKNNDAYKEKFGFPFVICARLNNKQAILTGFKTRLGNSRGEEIQAALQEIFAIAKLRLRDLISD